MKIVILIHSLWFLSISFAFSQQSADSACNATIKSIFQVHDLKIRYEAVRSLYKILDIEDSVIRNKRTYLHVSKSALNTYFESVSGQPMDGYESSVLNSEQNTKRKRMFPEDRKRDHQQLRDSTSRLEPVPVVWVTDEEMNSFVKQINCTPREALTAYMKFVQGIKSERDMYAKCIDTELAKGDLSEFAKESLLYTFLEPGNSISGPRTFTKLEFLNFFKEFILNDDIEILPDDVRVQVY